MEYLSKPMLILLPILLPIFGGALVLFFQFRQRKWRQLYVTLVVSLTTLISLGLIIWGPKEEIITVLRFSQKLPLAFRIDGMATVFGSLVAVLWPLATCYAFEYMKHEGRENKFFAFYTITFGITLGIAFAANILTLYLFYELLTLVTFPLVIHTMDQRAITAGRTYIIYSMSGAALIFIGLIFIITYGSSIDFVYGGVFSPQAIAKYGDILSQVYVLTFFGFGVKAALFPMQQWLPAVSVAPTTVTALLHAVAVVKAGVFAIMRLTYFSFGTGFLVGTRFQWAVMIGAMITILYGSFRAFINPHFKRRLAYSTISQLSYMILAAALMTSQGLQSGLLYMVGHAFIKIVLFYCAGAVLYQTHQQEVAQLAGLGRKMPWTFGCFTIAAFGLMGIPPTVGFLGKYELLTAIAESGSALTWVGLVVIGISVLLTAGYLLSIIKTAFFDEFVPDESNVEVKDPNGYMLIPMVVLTGIIVLLGFFGQPIMDYFAQMTRGGV